MARNLGFFIAFLRYRPNFALGYLIVAAAVLAGTFAPWIAPYSPVEPDFAAFLQPPSMAHPFGTDSAGLDILSRVIYAPRIDITIAVLGTAMSVLVGTILGALIGYYDGRGGLRGIISGTSMRAADVLQAFPVFAFALVLAAALGQSVQGVVYAIAFVNMPIYLRLMRTQVMSLRDRSFVEASVVAGASDLRTIFRHVVPNAMAPILAQMSVNIGWAILLTSGLSFIGAGVRAPTPEWGSMIAIGFQNMVIGQWWPSLFPGLVLSLTVFGFSLIGSSIEVLTDPIKRGALGDLITAPKGHG
jgi:peptide/nickel transport system permease protein